MYRNFIKNHLTFCAILIFLILYFIILHIKPTLIYEEDGSLRHFGIGYDKRTVLPAWLVAIILAIFSYFFVLYYTSNKKIYF